MDTETEQVEIDWELGRELTGATPKQVEFVKAIIQGANQTQAARMAGYSGSADGLRAVGSKIANTKKVQTLVAWAHAGGAGQPDAPGDVDELKRILWRHARGKDKGWSIKSTEILNRIAAQEAAEAREAVQYDPLVTLDKIAELSPVYAMMLARHNNMMKWTAPEVALEKARAELAAMAELVRSHAAARANGVAHDA